MNLFREKRKLGLWFFFSNPFLTCANNKRANAKIPRGKICTLPNSVCTKNWAPKSPSPNSQRLIISNLHNKERP